MSNDDKNPPYHKPLIVNGQLYDFCHLEPFIFQFSDDINERSIEYTINVRFSNHCFSKKIDDVQTDGTIIWDGKQKRCFEPDRYTLSTRLPSIIQGLPTQKVFKVQEGRNYVAYQVLTEISGERVYRIFLNLKISSQDSARAGCNLDLFVESAYLAARLSGTSPIRFTKLCYNILNKIPVRCKR